MDRRLYWIMGATAPIFFTVAVVVLGVLKPGYSYIYNTISELGETGSAVATPAALVFVITGIMITVFGYGLQMKLRGKDHVSMTGILVMLYGVLDFMGSGIFPVDAGGAASTLVSTIHVNATLIGELAALGMSIWFLKDTEGDYDWERLRRFSEIVFGVSLPLVVFLGYCILGHTPGQIDTPIGLAQRLLVGLFLLWIMVTAYSLLRHET
jgi:hypothetical membrane protein